MAKDSDKLIADQAKQIKALKEAARKKEAKASTEMEDQVDWSRQLLDIESERIKGWKVLQESQELTSLVMKDLRDTTKQMSAIERKSWITDTKREKVLQQNLKAQIKIYDLEKEALPYRKKLLESQQKLNKLHDKYKESVEESLDFFDDFNSKIKSIPIVGDFLSKAIGLDKIKEELTDKFTSYLTNALDPASAAQAAASAEAVAGYEAQIAAQGILAAESGVVAAESGVIATEIGVAATETVALTAGTAAASVGAMGFASAMGAAAVAAAAALAPMLPLIALAASLLATIGFIKKGLELDQEISDLAKGMGQTKHEAEEAHHQFLEIAKTTSVIGANDEAIAAANQDLNAILGTNVTASREMLEAQVLLTKQYGLTGAEAAEFQAVSAGTGKTVEQNLLMVESMVEGYNTMTGDSVNFKEISKDIAKTSKATLASYKGNVKALTMAAIQAKKMGMSLEDTQQVADKLLDIESSVEAEMKANVLTGKHMNMNAARQLALEGKTAEAAAEAVSQAGSLSELNDMNIIQRKSIADAAGVTVDQLMKSAELQEYSNALNGAEITDMKDLTDAQINQLMSQKSITEEKAAQLLKDKQIASNQEKMAAAADKMSAVFAGIASIMLPIVDAIATIATGIGDGIVKSLEFVKQLWTDIAPYVEGIATTVAIMLVPSLYAAAASMVTMAVTALPGILASVGAWAVEQGAVAISAAATAIAAISSASALTLGLGAVAIAGGIAVAAAAMTSEKDKAKKVDDAQIDPEGGLIVQGKEGKYQLNKNDSIVAGTNLGGAINDSAPMETGDTGILGGLVSAITAPFDAVGSLLSGGNDNAEVVALLRELIAKVEQPVMVNIGGRVVDEMEKQTSLRKTYNTKMDSGYGTFG